MSVVTDRPPAVVRATVPLSAARRVVLVASVVAALTHVWVVPEHWAEWRLAAMFFVVVAGCQLAIAAWVSRPAPPSPRAVAVALTGTVGLVVLYVATRTVDLPFMPVHGPEHLPVAWGVGNGVPIFPGDRIEEVGLPDMVCLAAELVTVAALCALATPAQRRRTTNGLVLLGLGLLALRAVGVLA